MSANPYIVIADITHTHVKAFSDPTKQNYVDEANDHYEDIALGLGVNIDDIEYPITSEPKRYINNFLVMRFAEDRIGVNNIETPENDLYLRMYEHAEDNTSMLKSRLTAEIIKGTADNSRTARSVSFGRRFRGD